MELPEIPAAPRSERLEFSKFKHAMSMFTEARDALQYIKDERIAAGHRLHHSLWTAFYIFYGKPFKQRSPVKLTQEIVPQEFRAEHESIIMLRDKMFAHSDVDNLATGGGAPLNTVVVSFRSGTPQFGFRFIHPTNSELDRYLDLLTVLVKKTSYHSSKFWNKWVRKGMKLHHELQYRVNTDADSDAVLSLL